MTLFDKCKQFNKHKVYQSKNLYPYFLNVEENYGSTAVIEGREVIMAGSNNYLGLSTDQRILNASMEASQKFGNSTTGSRLLSGTFSLHQQLEKEMAEFLGKEACLVFPSGFQMNQGVIVPLIGKNDYVISDKDNHNSIVQATLITKGLFGKKNVIRYKHNDMGHLEKVVSLLPEGSGKLIVADGIFSMTGNIVKLPELVEIAQKYNTKIMLDDAHATGVIGDNGRGTASYFNLENEVDLITGTFSKAFGGIGGFVAGDLEVIEYIKHKSSANIFSTSMPPSIVASNLKALKIIRSEKGRIDRLQQLSSQLRSRLIELGFKVLDGHSAIIPIIIGDDEETILLWKWLLEQGVYTNPVLNPAVPVGSQLIRICLMATHTDVHIEKIIESFKSFKANKKMPVYI